MRVTSLQLEIAADESKEARVERVARLVAEQDASDLVVLPEIWNVGYFNFDRYRAEAETLEGDTVGRMREAARAARAWVLAGSIVEASNGALHNTSVLIDRSGDVAAAYRKIHLFGFGSRERDLLSPGEKAIVAETEFGALGLATCYDLRFPELFRAMVDAGAEAFLVTSAWPYPRVEAWTTLNRARALENQAWLVSANCAAGETPACCGRSMVVDPWGTPVAAAGDRPGAIAADIDLAAATAARAEFPALADRVLDRGGRR